jgi:hypothetical protein
MPETMLEKLRSGLLWEEFCDELKAAGSEVLAAGVPDDDLTLAEGYRYLTRLLRLSLEKHIEFNDPHFPRFYSLSHETAKIGNDNPDNHYLNCAIDGSLDYRISGRPGTVSYLSLETTAGSYAGGGAMVPTGHVELAGLDVDNSGRFEIIVSSREHSGNWLPMRQDSTGLLVRQTFRDRSREQSAQLRIECLNPKKANTLDAHEFASQLASVVPFVTGTAGLFRSWMGQFGEHLNQLPANDQQMCLQAGGDPSIHYHNSCWRLAPDEALLIQFQPPDHCRGWNFQLSNYWMESLDYRYHRISINSYRARARADGSIQLVVAHRDPGPRYPNWLTTAGHDCGAMLLRYVDARDFPPVVTRVVTMEQLARDD